MNSAGVRIVGIIRSATTQSAEVEDLLGQAVAYSRTEGAGTLAHDIYRGPDGVTFAFHEAWLDSSAALSHQANLPAAMLDRIGEIATLQRLEVFGNASVEYRQKLGYPGLVWYPSVVHL
jgi:quinol monooxygenase YgiN